MVAAFSLATLLFASAIAAKPVVERNQLVKLALTRNRSHSVFAVAQDRHRAESLSNPGARIISSQAENQQSTAYLATVGVGNPPTNCK